MIWDMESIEEFSEFLFSFRNRSIFKCTECGSIMTAMTRCHACTKCLRLYPRKLSPLEIAKVKVDLLTSGIEKLQELKKQQLAICEQG